MNVEINSKFVCGIMMTVRLFYNTFIHSLQYSKLLHHLTTRGYPYHKTYREDHLHQIFFNLFNSFYCDSLKPFG